MPQGSREDHSRTTHRRRAGGASPVEGPAPEDRPLSARFSTQHVATNRVGADLQDTLVELIDLALQAKQAHWNVTGPVFLPLHEQLDALSAHLHAAADEVAERAVTIGYPPDGRSTTVALESPLPEMRDGLLADHAVVDLIVKALDIVTERVPARIERLAQLDPASEDLMIGVLRGLDKQRWMFEAQGAGRSTAARAQSGMPVATPESLAQG